MTDSDFYEISIDAQAARMELLALPALKAWDITDCQPKLIKIRENAVFRVTRADGFDAALRIHRYNYHSDAALQSELRWRYRTIEESSYCSLGFEMFIDDTPFHHESDVPNSRDVGEWIPGDRNEICLVTWLN